MKTIDHRFYPHIIDTVWSYFDFHGYVAAQSVCKDWKARVEAVRGPKHISIRRRKRRLEICERDVRDSTASKLFYTVKHFSKGVDPLWLRLAKDVEVVDLWDHYADFSEKQMEWLTNWTKNMPVVRQSRPGDVAALTYETMVIFQDVVQDSSVPCYGWECGPREPRHLVLSTNCLADPTNTANKMKSRMCIFDGDNELFTLILQNKCDPSAERPFAGLDFGFLLEYLRTVETCEVVELVGLELFIPDRQARKTFQAELRRLFAADNDGTYAGGDVRELWKFYTHKQYKMHQEEKHVGKETYLRYTVAPLETILAPRA